MPAGDEDIKFSFLSYPLRFYGNWNYLNLHIHHSCLPIRGTIDSTGIGWFKIKDINDYILNVCCNIGPVPALLPNKQWLIILSSVNFMAESQNVTKIHIKEFTPVYNISNRCAFYSDPENTIKSRFNVEDLKMHVLR